MKAYFFAERRDELKGDEFGLIESYAAFPHIELIGHSLLVFVHEPIMKHLIDIES